MMDALFDALGAIFASGIGVLLLAVVAGVVFVIWDWRLALGGSVLIHLGSASLLVHIHNVPGIVAAGQMVAVLLCAAMLTLVATVQPFAISPQQAGNWPLRALALVFILAAWWFMDPGYVLPLFSLPETELLLWTALCALAFWSFSSSPLFGGIGVLLWSTSFYALAAVLLPGSGLAAVVGIVDLFVVLACAYLVLLEPAASGPAAHTLAPVLPLLRKESPLRPWGLMRRQPAPAAVASTQVAALADPGTQVALGGIAPAADERLPSAPAVGAGAGPAAAPAENHQEKVAP